MANFTPLPQYKTPERKLEKLLLSLNFCRTQWDAELALMSADDKKKFASLVSDTGIVERGSRQKFECWKREHVAKVRDAAKTKKESAAKPANETGESASE